MAVRLMCFVAIAGLLGGFGGLFGRRAKAEPPADNADLIEMFREDGTPVRVRRSDFRKMMLDAVHEAWDDPDALYGRIVQGLRDDFAEALGPAAERLLSLDGESERATIVAALVRSGSGDVPGAKRLLEAFGETRPSGVVLTNLAKLQDAEGDRRTALATVRRGLAIDPNQDVGLALYGRYRQDEEGEAGFLAALEEIAREPGSWRALLWMARDRLAKGDAPAAIELDRRVLDTGLIDASGMAILTGDLGQHGQLEAMLELALARYEIARHGAEAGMNLIVACAELGRVPEGLAICEVIEGAGRVDLKGPLAELRHRLEASPR